MRRTIAGIVVFAFVSTGITGLVPAHAGRAPGDRLWVSRYTSPEPKDTTQDVPSTTVQGAHGTLFIVGNSGDDGYGPPPFVEALRPTDGSRLWMRRPRTGSWANGPAAVSPDGAVLFVGGETGPAHGSTFVIVAYRASTGETLWRHRTGFGSGVAWSSLTSLVVAPDGRSVIVGGSIATGTPPEVDVDAVVIGYDAATGAQRWLQQVRGADQRDVYGSGLTMAPNGSAAYMDATIFGPRVSDVLVGALDTATGHRVWMTRFRQPATTCGQRFASSGSTAITPDGAELILTVAAERPRCFGHYVETVAYGTETGSVLWKRAFAPRDAMGDGDYPWDLSMSATGSEALILVNHASGPRLKESVIVLAYDTGDGAMRWRARFKGPRGCDLEGHAMAVASRRAELYVTATACQFGDDSDIATIALGTAAGRTHWIRTADAGRDGWGVDVVADPRAARVFVTGRTYGSATYANVVTIAYRT